VLCELTSLEQLMQQRILRRLAHVQSAGIVVTNIAGLGSGAIFLMWSVAALCSAATVPRVGDPASLTLTAASLVDALQTLTSVFCVRQL